MRIVLQRVRRASVLIDGSVYSSISKGILAFVAFSVSDGDSDINYLSKKLVSLRIFPDDKGLMNYSLIDIGGELMLVSQFTLYGDCRKGRRPSYSKALSGDMALSLYDKFVNSFSVYNLSSLKTGKFAADMDIDFINWGPVTLLLDSEKVF